MVVLGMLYTTDKLLERLSVPQRCYEKFRRMVFFECTEHFKGTEVEVSYNNQWLTDSERANLWRALYDFMELSNQVKP